MVNSQMYKINSRYRLILDSAVSICLFVQVISSTKVGSMASQCIRELVEITGGVLCLEQQSSLPCTASDVPPDQPKLQNMH